MLDSLSERTDEKALAMPKISFLALFTL